MVSPVLAMSQAAALCRLCVNACHNYKSLYDNHGHSNETYDITVKYFDPLLLILNEGGGRPTVMCLECWRHICDFHSFQQSVLQAQAKLLEDGKLAEVLVESQVECPSDRVTSEDFLIDIVVKEEVEFIAPPDIDVPPVSSCNDTHVSAAPFGGLNQDSSFTIRSFSNLEIPLSKSINPIKAELEDNQIVINVLDKEVPTTDVIAGPMHITLNDNTHKPTTINRKVDGSVPAIIAYRRRIRSEPKKFTCKVCGRVFSRKANFCRHVTKLHKISKDAIHSVCDDNASTTDGHPQKDNNGFNDIDQLSYENFDGYFNDEREQANFCRYEIKSIDDPLSSDDNDISLSEYLLQAGETNDVSNSDISQQGTNISISRSNKMLPKQWTAKELDYTIAQWNPTLQCRICKGSYSNFGMLQNHFRKKHPTEEFYFTCCKCKFKSRNLLAEHTRFHIDPNAFKCELCGKRFARRQGLHCHLLKKHKTVADKSYRFPDIQENREDDASDGIKSAKESDYFIAQWMPNLACVECYELCPTFSLLEQHFQQHHPNESCYIVCCHRMFNKRHLVEEHMRSHLEAAVFACKVCGKSFSRKFNLSRHLMTQHHIDDVEQEEDDDDAEEDHQTNEDALEEEDMAVCKYEIRSVDGQYNSEDDEVYETTTFSGRCNSTATKEDLTADYDASIYEGNDRESSTSKRVRKKTEELDDVIARWRPNLECNICNGSFPRFTRLQDHFRQEHPDEDYCVSCCKYKFMGRHEFVEHIKLHLDPNTFQCKICDKSFTKKLTLHSHMLKQHDVVVDNDGVFHDSNGIKSLKESDDLIAQWMSNPACVECNVLCSSYSLLQQHFLEHHADVDCYIVCCERKLSRRHIIEEHIRGHLDANVFGCKICGKSYSRKFNLRRHMLSQHNNSKEIIPQADDDNFSSNDVADNYPSQSLIASENISQADDDNVSFNDTLEHSQNQDHISLDDSSQDDESNMLSRLSSYSPTNQTVVGCKLCGKCFSRKSNLCRHLINQHSIPKKDISHEDYEKFSSNNVPSNYRKPRIRRKSAYNLDSLIAQWKPNLECVQCSETCSSFTLLQEHFLEKHPQERCYISCCNLKYSSRYDISEHARMHFDRDAFRCKLCGKGLTGKSNLKRHMHDRHGV